MVKEKRTTLATDKDLGDKIRNIAKVEETKEETITKRALKSYLDHYKQKRRPEVVKDD